VAEVPADPSADARVLPSLDRIEVTPREMEIGRLLYKHLETAKDRLRGRHAKRSIIDTRAALLEAASSGLRVPADRDLIRFVADVDELVTDHYGAR
jgi:hypothetical protein